MDQHLVIDGLQFARSSSELAGRIDGVRLTRLAGMQCRLEEVVFLVTGGVNANGKPSLRVKLSGEFHLVCQRCLMPLLSPLLVDSELELSRSMDEIQARDDDVDCILAAREMDIEALIEDEVILALPMIPRHESCELLPEVKKSETQVVKPASPFGVLGSLKQRPGGR